MSHSTVMQVQDLNPEITVLRTSQSPEPEVTLCTAVAGTQDGASSGVVIIQERESEH